MFRVKEQSGNFVEVEAIGRVTDGDYRKLVPQLERILDAEGKLRALIDLEEFEGWSGKGLAEDLRFDLAHRKDFERIAVVGNHRWERALTTLSSPFFSGEARFFDVSDKDAARHWVRHS